MQTNPCARFATPLFAVLAGLVLISTGCTPSGPKALLQGEELIRKGKYQEATAKLELAVNLLPGEARAWNYLGMARHGAGQYAEAALAYERALELNRNLAEARFNLGRLRLDQGEYFQAVEQLTIFTGLEEKSVDGFVLLGDANLALQRHEQAINAYHRALNLEYATPAAFNGIGLIYQAKNNPQEAYRYFSEAVKQDPDYAPAILNLAVLTHTKLAAKPFALAKYHRYLEVAPDAPNAAAVARVIEELDQELNPKPVATVVVPPVEKLPPAGVVETNAAVTAVTTPATNKPPAPVVVAKVDEPAKPKPEPEPAPKETIEPAKEKPKPAPVAAAPEPIKTAAKTNAPVQVAKAETPVEKSPVNAAPPPKPATVKEAPPKVAPTPEPKNPAPKIEVSGAEKARLQETIKEAPRPEPEPVEEAPLEVVDLGTTETGDGLPIAEKPDAEPAVSRSEASAPEPKTVPLKTEEPREKRGFFARINPANLWRSDPEEPKQVKSTEIITPLPAPSASTPTSGSKAPPPAKMASSGTYSEVTPMPQSSGPRRYLYGLYSKPVAGDRASAERLFQRGLDAQAQLNPGGAASFFASAALADPTYFPAQYNLGLTSYQTGQLMKSLSAFETALALDENSVEARYNFALSLMKAKYALDAVAELEKVLAVNPDDVRANLLMGNIYDQELGNKERARSHYEKVIALDPKHPQAASIRFWLAANPDGN